MTAQQQLPPMQTYVAVLRGSVAAPEMNIQWSDVSDESALGTLQHWARYIDTGHHWNITVWRKVTDTELRIVGSVMFEKAYTQTFYKGK